MINLLPLVTDTQVFLFFCFIYLFQPPHPLTVQLILHGPQNLYDMCQLHIKSWGMGGVGNSINLEQDRHSHFHISAVPLTVYSLQFSSLLNMLVFHHHIVLDFNSVSVRTLLSIIIAKLMCIGPCIILIIEE